MGKLKWQPVGKLFLNISDHDRSLYFFSLIEQIVPVWAVSGIATGWLIFWAVVVCAYGADHGMQRRGRMAGVSGGTFFICDHTYAAVVYRAGECRIFERNAAGKSIVGERRSFTARMMWCVRFSGISLLPFVLQNVEKRGNSGKIVTSAILTVSGILLLILFILPSVLGWGRIQKELYPVLPLMQEQTCREMYLPGLMYSGLVFYCTGIFFALGSCFHYGIHILDTVHLRSGKYWLPIVIYAFSFVRINDSGIADFYKMYLGTFFWFRELVLIQICLLFRGQKNEKKKISFCSGCFNGIYSELYRLCRNRTGKENVSAGYGS